MALTLWLGGAPPASAAALAPTPVNTSAPTLTGTPTPGQTLTCSPGNWSGNPSSFSYAWLHDGSPIAGQTASTYLVQTADQGRSISCNVTATNAGGEYTIAGLRIGSYQVSFGHPLGIILEGNYLPQYFNGQSSAASANLVSVTMPNTVSGIDAQLQPGGQITGRMTSAVTHAAIPNVEVCADGSALVFAQGSCATTDSGGDYTIVGLPSGSYEVGASVYGLNCMSKNSCPEQNYLPGSRENVAVAAPDTTSGADVELQPGGEITGQVTDATTHAPLGSIQVCASWSHREFVTSCTSTNSAGDYTLVALPSRSFYSVTFTAQTCVEGQGCSRRNYPPQTIEPVSVTAPNTTSVDAELQPGGEITGKVTGAAIHEPITSALVCAVEEAGGIESSCAHTDSAGEYTVAGLRSGSYKVSFSASEYQEAQTYSVTVTAPNTVSGVDAELHPQPKGEITGRVTDATTHAPIANIRACVSEEGTQWGLWGCPTTNSAGEYSLKVPSGSYKVVFTTTTDICEIWGTIGCTEPNYLGQTISAVSVTAPNTTASVDAELQPGGAITGRVTSAATHEGLAGVVACAFLASGESFSACGVTNGAGGSASASSNTLVVTAQQPTGGTQSEQRLTLEGKPSFNAKTDTLVFTFQVQSAGRLSWSLFFHNPDIGLAASLGVSPGEAAASAEVARNNHHGHKKHRRAKKCKSGLARGKHKCVPVTESFASGSVSVSAGKVNVGVHASTQSIEALKNGHALRVSGTFTFQSVLGGPPVTSNASIVVQVPEKSNRHKKGRRHTKHHGPYPRH